MSLWMLRANGLPTPRLWRLGPVRLLRSGFSTTITARSAVAEAPSRNHARDAAKTAFGKDLDEFKEYFKFPTATPQDGIKLGSKVTMHGFLGKPKQMSGNLMFVPLKHNFDAFPKTQIMSTWAVEGDAEHTAHGHLKSLPPYSAVAVTGSVVEYDASGIVIGQADVKVLSRFPMDIIVSRAAVFPPTARHLQLRFSQLLQRRLQLRSKVAQVSRRILGDAGLSEVETPLLFKSTPEGAREFLVPTRRRGLAYALPQSPQQFKQLLMAGGLPGYFQLARCFRDEDLRADRQPEFTQLDMEVAFATGETVMRTVEDLVKSLFQWLRVNYVWSEIEGVAVPVPRATIGTKSLEEASFFPDLSGKPFLRISYDEAMSKYGSDKPDLRIPGTIVRIEDFLDPEYIKRMTSLKAPIVEACKFRLKSPSLSRDFVQKIQKMLPKAFPHGWKDAHVFIYDRDRDDFGLAPLKPEVRHRLMDKDTEILGLGRVEEGDILIVQARSNERFQGGSTALGELRALFRRTALEAGVVDPDNRFMFLWITGFPMFTPNDKVDAGQEGDSGFSATHHPFTAPMTAEDFDLLLTDPLQAKADHYDLVVNGVELGGGSRRIHIAKVQEFVMRHVIGMGHDGMAQFTHLLEALRAGCPPHAGFALGFDRLMAVLCRTSSVRDVIAFPKSLKGEDLAVQSPGQITPKQVKTYHLAPTKEAPAF